MKLSKFFVMVFVCSFLAGIGLITITPTAVEAADSDCDYSCYKISCHFDASCNFPMETMHQKCYGNALLQYPCSQVFFSCGCVDIGCGPICQF